MPPEVSADPALAEPEEAGLEEAGVDVEESGAHEESGLGAGLVVVSVAAAEGWVAVVVVPGSELVESGVELVESVVVSVLEGDWDVVVDCGAIALAGVLLVVLEVVAGQPVVAAGVVVCVVEPASTVASVCVWVRPGGALGAVLVGSFVVASFVVAVPVCLASGLTGALCAAALAFVAAGLCGWTTAVWCSVRVRTIGVWMGVVGIVCGVLGTDATGVAAAAAW